MEQRCVRERCVCAYVYWGDESLRGFVFLCDTIVVMSMKYRLGLSAMPFRNDNDG